MWPDRRFADLIGVDHPIVQALMAGSDTPALAAAVAEAGGVGSLGVGPRLPEFAKERVVIRLLFRQARHMQTVE